MSNVVRFPTSRRVPAAPIPRAQFAALAEMALDLVDEIVRHLNDADGDPGLEPDADGEPSLAAPAGGESQIGWARGGDLDLERT